MSVQKYDICDWEGSGFHKICPNIKLLQYVSTQYVWYENGVDTFSVFPCPTTFTNENTKEPDIRWGKHLSLKKILCFQVSK